MEKLAIDAAKNGKYNVAFLAFFSLGRWGVISQSLCLSCLNDKFSKLVNPERPKTCLFKWRALTLTPSHIS